MNWNSLVICQLIYELNTCNLIKIYKGDNWYIIKHIFTDGHMNNHKQ